MQSSMDSRHIHNFLELSVYCSKNVCHCMCLCVCQRSGKAEQWGRARWLIKKSLLITIHGMVSFPPVSPTQSDTAHPSMVTGTLGMNKWNLGCQRAPPNTPTAIHSLNPPPLRACLSSSSPTHPWLWSASPPRPTILSGPADCNPAAHPLYLCRHTMGRESRLLATNPSEKVAGALERPNERER